MSINVPLGGAPTRWHNGQYVEERDLASKGQAPETPPAPLTDEWSAMPIPPLYNMVVDSSSNGVRQRLKDGRHEGQAWAAVFDGSELTSDVYGLVPEADPEPSPSMYDGLTLPMAEYSMQAKFERATRAATARALLHVDERSPLDMVGIARELGKEAQRRAHAYEQEQAKQAAQAKQDAEDMALAARVRRGMELLDKEQKKGKKA